MKRILSFIGSISKSKKKVLGLILILAILGGIVALGFLREDKKTLELEKTEDIPPNFTLGEDEPDFTKPLVQEGKGALPGPTVSESSKIEVSNVKVNNFYKDAKKINSQGDILISEEKDFDIVYFPKGDEFLISILSSPFYPKRLEAEKKLLETLGISEKDACKLDVSITTPAFVNQNEAGINYGLSFCK